MYTAYVILGDVTYILSESDNMAGAILIALNNLIVKKRPDLSSSIECGRSCTFLNSRTWMELPSE